MRNDKSRRFWQAASQLVVVQLTLAACGEQAPSLSQTPTAAGLIFADGTLEPRDVEGPPGGDASDGPEVPPDVAPHDLETPDDAPTGGGPDAAADAGAGGVDTAEPADGGAGPELPSAECETDEDCPQAGGCGVGRCAEGACTVAVVADGAPCDDGDVCTTGDACQTGVCRGQGARVCDDGDACTIDRCDPAVGCATDPVVCSDSDPCTTDSCDPQAGCVAAPVTCPPDSDPCTLEVCGAEGVCAPTPIVGCDGNDPCAGKPGGAACDDGSADTTADMCISGVCRGYLAQRISGRGVTTVTGLPYEGLIITEVDYGPGGWNAVLWSAGRTLGGGLMLAWTIGDLTDPAQPGWYRATLASHTQDWPREYSGLTDGFVIRGGERLFVFGSDAGPGWASGQTWNEALDGIDFDLISALGAVQDTDASGSQTTQRLWLGGSSQGDGLAIYCTRSSNARPRCSEQRLDSPRDSPEEVYPTAIAALPRCQATGCTGGWLAMAADYEVRSNGATRWSQESYLNPLGDGGTWSSAWSTPTLSTTETSAVGVWGSVVAPRVLLVGSDGLLVHGLGVGSGVIWMRLEGVQGLAERDFTGVAVSGDAVLVSATRRTSAQIIYELWAMPKTGNGGTAGAWTVHELLRGPLDPNQAGGLYDTDARPNGEVLAVGAVLRTDGSAWLDGLVMRRTAP